MDIHNFEELTLNEKADILGSAPVVFYKNYAYLKGKWVDIIAYNLHGHIYWKIVFYDRRIYDPYQRRPPEDARFEILSNEDYEEKYGRR